MPGIAMRMDRKMHPPFQEWRPGREGTPYRLPKIGRDFFDIIGTAARGKIPAPESRQRTKKAGTVCGL